MQSIITPNAQTRRLTSGVLKGLTKDQWFTIPDGFDNNIAWNVGHIITVQQSLIYRVSGLTPHTSKPFAKMFNPGTSPADWTSNPDPEELRALLRSTIEAWQTDYDAGLFVNFRPISTTTGINLNTIEESAAFNFYHEGLHLGSILALKNLV